MLPRSELIFLGMPCSETILAVYNSANCPAEIVSLTGRKWATLDKLSVTTKIALLPFCDLGNPVTKSFRCDPTSTAEFQVAEANLQASGVVPSLSWTHHTETRNGQHPASYESTKSFA